MSYKILVFQVPFTNQFPTLRRTHVFQLHARDHIRDDTWLRDRLRNKRQLLIDMLDKSNVTHAR
jgi:hypothetical protein